MRWLLDQGLPRTAADLLRAQDMDAIHVGEIGMAASGDPEIIEMAAREDRIVVTLDADFHALLAQSGATKPSVIRIREEGLKAPEIAKLVSRIACQFAENLSMGCVLTVHQSKARLRMLPIHS
jgi:predicted nuclease of predicted toxin-antitoxin system